MSLSVPKTSSGLPSGKSCDTEALMVARLIGLLRFCRVSFARRTQLEAENLLLRQQLIVLRRQHSGRLQLRNRDRLVMVWPYRLFPRLLNAILIVQPETIIRWHRRGFHAY
jgi:hypothetical protein